MLIIKLAKRPAGGYIIGGEAASDIASIINRRDKARQIKEASALRLDRGGMLATKFVVAASIMAMWQQ